MTHLSCDGCGKTYGVDMAFHYKGTQHRKEAKSEGWTYSSNKDWCPTCKPKKKNGEDFPKRTRKQLNKQRRNKI